MNDVRLLLLDVDGTLTSGQVYVFPFGGDVKAFHVHDGIGIRRAIENGIHVGLITGRRSASVSRRAKELGVRTVIQGCDDKAKAVNRIAKDLGVSFDEIAYIGDDLNDLPVMQQVGYPIAVANAVEAVRAASIRTTELCGGEGAVREAIEWLLSESRTPSFSIAIPARLHSTRLPRKVLIDICGRPMLQHVYQAAASVEAAEEVVILTDSGEVKAAAEDWGARVVQTPADCSSGTERIASVIDQLSGDLIVNIQADQPFLTERLIDDLVSRSIAAWQDGDVFTPVFAIQTTEELIDEALVKTVRDGSGRAVYFSRAAVPYLRDQPVDRWLENTQYWGHQGIYLFKRAVLEGFFDLETSRLETAEKLEQLRFMENGLQIHTLEIEAPSLSVDLPEHLKSARFQMESTNGSNGAGGPAYA